MPNDVVVYVVLLMRTFYLSLNYWSIIYIYIYIYIFFFFFFFFFLFFLLT